MTVPRYDEEYADEVPFSLPLSVEPGQNDEYGDGWISIAVAVFSGTHSRAVH